MDPLTKFTHFSEFMKEFYDQNVTVLLIPMQSTENFPQLCFAETQYDQNIVVQIARNLQEKKKSPFKTSQAIISMSGCLKHHLHKQNKYFLTLPLLKSFF